MRFGQPLTIRGGASITVPHGFNGSRAGELVAFAPDGTVFRGRIGSYRPTRAGIELDYSRLASPNSTSEAFVTLSVRSVSRTTMARRNSYARR
jgi:hypothetical protein